MMFAALAFNVFAGELTDPTTTSNSTDLKLALDSSYSSETVFRGAELGNNQVDGSLSAEFNLPVSDIVMTTKTEYSTVDGSNQEALVETAFSKSIEDYLIGLSYTWYSQGLDKQGGQDQEVGFSVSKPIGPVTLSYTQYLAIEGENNGYGELSAKYSLNIQPIVLDFSSELGYLFEDESFTHTQLMVSTDLPVTENIVASPFVAYNLDLGSGFATNIQSDSTFFGGVLMKKRF